MRMRARNYGIVNRCIARSVTYSLRNYGKNNNHKTNTYGANNTNPTQNIGCGTVLFIILVIFIITVSLASH